MFFLCPGSVVWLLGDTAGEQNNPETCHLIEPNKPEKNIKAS